MSDDAADSARADGDEPRDHHRTERSPDGGGAVPLHVEQRDDDDHGDRHHPLLEIRVDDLDALDGGQHRNRRGDHAVAEEQRGAEDAERGEDQRGAVTGLRPPAAQQR